MSDAYAVFAAASLGGERMPRVTPRLPTGFCFLLGILPLALGFAAGAMIFVVLSAMLPEALRRAGPNTVAVYCAVAFTATDLCQLAVSLA